MRKELLKGLTEEQIKKVKECKSSEEILDLAKAEGVQLSDEQLEAVSGGGCIGRDPECPKCGSKNLKITYHSEDSNAGYYEEVRLTDFKCKDCGHKWSEKK